MTHVAQFLMPIVMHLLQGGPQADRFNDWIASQYAEIPIYADHFVRSTTTPSPLSTEQAASRAIIAGLPLLPLSHGDVLFTRRGHTEYRQLFISRPTGSRDQLTTAPQGIDSALVSPHEQRVLATARSHDRTTLDVVDLAASTLVVSVTEPSPGLRGIWWPDSASILYGPVQHMGEWALVRRWIDSEKIATIPCPDDEGAYPVIVSHTGARVVVAADHGGPYWTADTAAWSWAPLPSSSYGTLIPAGISRDDRYVVCEARSSSYAGDSIVVVDVASGRMDRLFSGFTLDRNDDSRSVFCPENDVLCGVVWESGYQHMRAWDLAGGRVLRRSLAGRGYRYADIEWRDGRLGFLQETFEEPLTLLTWDLRTPHLDAIPVTPSGIDLQTRATRELEPLAVHYPAGDGLLIPGYLILPSRGETAGDLPMVVYVHGGPASYFVPFYNPWFHYFLSRGYGVLVPNIRGSSGFGKWYRDLDNEEKRLDAIHDIIAGARWLVDKGYTTPERIGLWGQSYGGFAVLLAAMEAPGQFGAVAADCPVTDMELLRKGQGANASAEYGDLQDPAFLAKVSPILRAAELNTPTVIVHGDGDQIVPIDHATSFVTRCRELSKPVELLILPEEGHTFRKPHNMHAAFDIKARLFNKHLRDRPATAANDPQGDAGRAEQPARTTSRDRSGE